MGDFITKTNDEEYIKNKINDLLKIVGDLEEKFKGEKRKFTLDGHLLGSIGEVMAKYYYGIELYPPSHKIHDGYKGEKKVQIKITQTDRIVITSKPDNLIALFFNKETKEFLEIYNGPGDEPWKVASSHKGRISVKKLKEQNNKVSPQKKFKGSVKSFVDI